MLEIKTDKRQYSQPNAPDISGLAKAVSNIGQTTSKALSMVATGIHEYKEAARIIEEKSLLAGASTDIERAALPFANNPGLSMEDVSTFETQVDAISQGYLSNASPQSRKQLESDLGLIKSKTTTKLMGDVYKIASANETRNISLSINDLQTSMVDKLSNGDTEGALKDKSDLDLMLHALGQRGASASQLTSIFESNQALAISAQGISELKSVESESARNEIVKKYSELTPTPAHIKAWKSIYEFNTKLNKLYKEGKNISGAIEAAETGQPWLNYSLNAKDTDLVEDTLLKNKRRSGNVNPIIQQEDRGIPVAQFMSKDDGKTYTYYKDKSGKVGPAVETTEGAEPIKSSIPDYLTRAYVAANLPEKETIEEIPNTLRDMADVRILVGSPNGTKFDNELKNRLHAGNGALAYEAALEIARVNQISPQSLALDDATDMIASEILAAVRGGRTDYDQIAQEARTSVNKTSQTNMKANAAIFDSTNSLVSEKGLKNLSRSFTTVTGFDPKSTDSRKALIDFYKLYRKNFLLSDGKEMVALDTTRRQMARAYGSDILSGGSYVQFPTSLLMPGFNSTQINNQMIQQLVKFSETNKNIILPEQYQAIKKFNETDLMEREIALIRGPEKLEWQKGVPIYITQHMEGIGKIEGKLFLKSNELTAINNSGSPIWEAWIKDDRGNEYPIYDDKSPYKNTLLLKARTMKEFVPHYAEVYTREEFEKNVNNVLVDEGRKLFSVFDINPLTIKSNYDAREAYRNDPANKEFAKKRVAKALGIEGSK